MTPASGDNYIIVNGTPWDAGSLKGKRIYLIDSSGAQHEYFIADNQPYETTATKITLDAPTIAQSYDNATAYTIDKNATKCAILEINNTASPKYALVDYTGWSTDDLKGKLFFMTDSNGAVHQYVIDGNESDTYNNATCTRITIVGSDNLLTGVSTATTDEALIYTYHTDAQGNVMALTDNTGQIVETYKYDIYGRLRDVLSSDKTAYLSEVCKRSRLYENHRT